MKKIRSLFLASALGVPAIMMADYALVVELSDGDIHEYTMQQQPVVRFVADGVTIASNGEVTEYPKSEFGRFYFKEISGAQTNVEEIGVNVDFKFLDKNTVCVRFTPDGDSRIALYDLSGRMVSKRMPLMVRR